ncbi:diguanylate cyclase (GGDEF)-like protein [Saccharopolyspora erythraea NRRL 2338]|uniref:GGDEF domain-containing protein n=1 Tax=Saccharopolyspora erythraea TaxID=1836 RepID=UPI000C001FA0|nr:GGDEF domain-containing protein [Saccharopolyspora erythraea]PFG92788.1 diguanylate cyclase (GGDEF)-like protein [Saccharopolyspora erythraea NRRL 2338]
MFAEIAIPVLTGGWAAVATATTINYRRRTLTDPVTGIGNRAALYRTARRTTARSGLVGLLMVDLDRFKQINDTHGHPFGNRVLTAIATRLIENTLRGSARCGCTATSSRSGSDASPPPPAPKAAPSRSPTPSPNPSRSAAVGSWCPGSVGVAVAPARTPLGELLNTADQHMYQVKATHHLPALPAGEPRRARDRATPPDHAA